MLAIVPFSSFGLPGQVGCASEFLVSLQLDLFGYLIQEFLSVIITL
jgi:hypothetical protein